MKFKTIWEAIDDLKEKASSQEIIDIANLFGAFVNGTHSNHTQIHNRIDHVAKHVEDNKLPTDVKVWLDYIVDVGREKEAIDYLKSILVDSGSRK